jgi:hypothetical protein
VEIALALLIGLVVSSLGLPWLHDSPVPENTPNQTVLAPCRSDPEDRIALKDLSRPYAEGRFYPATGCQAEKRGH